MLPCPRPAAPPPSCRPPVCSSSLEGLHRDPATLWRPCVCQTRRDFSTEQQRRRMAASPRERPGDGQSSRSPLLPVHQHHVFPHSVGSVEHFAKTTIKKQQQKNPPYPPTQKKQGISLEVKGTQGHTGTLMLQQQTMFVVEVTRAGSFCCFYDVDN